MIYQLLNAILPSKQFNIGAFNCVHQPISLHCLFGRVHDPDSMSHLADPDPEQLFFVELSKDWQVDLLIDHHLCIFVEVEVIEQLCHPGTECWRRWWCWWWSWWRRSKRDLHQKKVKKQHTWHPSEIWKFKASFYQLVGHNIFLMTMYLIKICCEETDSGI